jgi:chorismate dehydratase
MAMGSSSNERLRLGRIGYLNVLPIYYPLEAGIITHPFTIISGVPAYLNRLMVQGELELSVVSSIEYARYPDRYVIVPDLSISCRGAVRSVLLLSRAPVDQLSGQTILASSQSHTSVALLRILLTTQLGIEFVFSHGSCTEALASGGEPPVAMLAIGDEALRLREHPLYPYRWDLGEVWHAWTGLPFVFALWVIQRAAFERWNGLLAEALETLSMAKEWGRSHLDEICWHALKEGILNLPQLQDYYQCLNYDLNGDEKLGMERFYQHLANRSEIRRAPALQIYSPLARVA